MKKHHAKAGAHAASGDQISRKTRGSVPLFSSIRFRIMFTIGIAVFIAVLSVLLVVTIPVRKELDAVNTDYLYNQTLLYGQKLETAVNLTQYHTDISKVPFRLEAFLQGAKLERCESSYCFLVREDGIVLMHPDHTKVGRQIKIDVIGNIAQQTQSDQIPEPGIVTYQEDGVEKIASYYASSKGFVLVIAVDRADFFSTINRRTTIAILTGIAIFAVMLAFGWYQALRITRPIETVSDVVDRIGALDFTADPRADELARRKDETGVIANSVKNMRQKLVKIIEEIKNQSTLLYGTSSELFESAKDTRESASHIDSAVKEIATGASETQRANHDVGVIGEMIVDTGVQVSGLMETANMMRQTSEKAFETLTELVRINEQTSASIDRIYEQTNETNLAAEKIKEVAALIEDLASETNLLSLNARIEAATAGEQGKGFAVVAEGVQKLADASSASAQNITIIIQDLVTNSTKAVEIMDEVREVMQKQSAMVEQTEEAFRIVRGGIDGSLSNAANIRQQANRLDSAREGIINTVGSLSSIASQNAENSQETSDTLSNILRDLQVMADGIDRLNGIAETLETNVQEIRI
ncbi:MAG: methyl-accepting chemotaxis protein [Lachnospiraceae bacterium]|nr:methyl-accepting chemotaxis protein [Lachnospiraceae bacterium]